MKPITDYRRWMRYWGVTKLTIDSVGWITAHMDANQYVDVRSISVPQRRGFDGLRASIKKVQWQRVSEASR